MREYNERLSIKIKLTGDDRDGKEILPSRLPSPQNSSNHEDFKRCDGCDGFKSILSKK